MRIVFMGTPAFSLPSLAALQESGEHEIVAVYTQPPRPAGRGQKETPSPVHAFALEHNLPVYTPVSLKTPEAQADFAAHNADLAVVVAYGLLLPKPILEAYPLGCVNVHPSLLPRWRGAAPIQRTLTAGDEQTGICIMQMDEGLDTGDVLLREEGIATKDFNNAGELHDFLAKKAAPLLVKTLAEIKTITPQKQSESGVTYAKKITKDECKIDWNKSAAEIYNMVRGLSPSPAAYFTYNDENIKVFAAEFEEGNSETAPGTVIERSPYNTFYRHCEEAQPTRQSSKNIALDKDGLLRCTRNDVLCRDIIKINFLVACGQGALLIKEAQRPGKKRMAVEEMLKSLPIVAGTKLD